METRSINKKSLFTKEMSMNIIESFLLNTAILRNGIHLLSKKDTIDFINLCSKEGICILGIDCFLLGVDWIQPIMDNSIDYSSAQVKKDEIYLNAIKFVNELDSKYYFEVTY
jgi:hypothetical protein